MVDKFVLVPALSHEPTFYALVQECKLFVSLTYACVVFLAVAFMVGGQQRHGSLRRAMYRCVKTKRYVFHAYYSNMMWCGCGLVLIDSCAVCRLTSNRT